MIFSLHMQLVLWIGALIPLHVPSKMFRTVISFTLPVLSSVAYCLWKVKYLQLEIIIAVNSHGFSSDIYIKFSALY